MTPQDIVYNEVYKGCLNADCDEHMAKNAAVMALQKFKNNQFQTPSKLITQSINEAKKLKVKKRKK